MIWQRIAGSLALVAAAFVTPAQADGKRLDVIELFTSQGCSSCPPADALLGEMASRSDVLALSYNVDYWDYLGWKDTLADPAFTARQKAYAHARGDRAVYTPQAVVNGLVHAVGSDRTDLTNAMQSTGDKLASWVIDLSARRDGDVLIVETGKANAAVSRPKPATVWLVAFDDARTVKIERGENSDRTITYSNVVRRIEKIGTWTGDAQTLTVPLPAAAGSHFAVLVQEGGDTKPGAILAAAKIQNRFGEAKSLPSPPAAAASAAP